MNLGMSFKCKLRISHHRMKQVLNKFRIKWCLSSYFSLPTKLLLIRSGIFGPIQAPPGRFDNTENQCLRSDFYLRQPRLPLVTNGGLVAIGTDQYHILQRVGGHYVTIDTNSHRCWQSLGKVRILLFLNLQSFGPGFWSRLFPFGPGKYKYPNTVAVGPCPGAIYIKS